MSSIFTTATKNWLFAMRKDLLIFNMSRNGCLKQNT